MRYLPTSAPIRQQMLADLGIASVDELFSHIPDYCRLKRPLDIPKGCSEAEIVEFFRAAAADNAPGFTSFLGAGAYYHFRPAHLDALIGRGEWFTAYTPYQAEISQGTLQSIFEFQTMICQLTGQDVANAGMYDGSTALNEACMMAARITGRSRFVVARSVHPQYREVLATHTQHRDFDTAEIGFTSHGAIDLEHLKSLLDENTAAVAVQSPNFFGTIENWNEAAALAHAHGALLVAVIAEPVSLGLLPPPQAADIVAMELQGFGIPVGFGGPYAGILATRERFVRNLPGRLVGEARDAAGRRGFVLTLSTREQHIRRDKATSNICTNQALCALMASIFMATYGKTGLRELAGHNLAKAVYAAHAFQNAGAEVLFPSAHFHEFVVRLKKPMAQWAPALRAAHLIGGLPLKRYYPDLGNAILVCVTETIPRKQIDRFVHVLTA